MKKAKSSKANAKQAETKRGTELPALKNSPTGIAGLDQALGGGFPKGAVVLLAGSSGSGKTILSLQWLFNGVAAGENGVYITLTEPLFKTLQNLENTSFYDRKAIEEERLKIVDLRNVCCGPDINAAKIINAIEKEVRETGAKRLCIDSVTAIAYNLYDKARIREFIFEIGKTLATLGCTTLITSEVTDHKQYSVYGVEEYISDVIMRLDQLQVRGGVQRRLQIVKMRGRGYSSELLSFKISEKGITVFPKIKVPLAYASTNERVSSGISSLDEMLGGGFLKASTNLVVGPTGTAKTILALHFALEGLKRGEPCLYQCFEESHEQILRHAEGFGWNLKEYEENGLLLIRCAYANEKLLDEHFYEIAELVSSRKIKRLVFDSVSSLGSQFPQDALVTAVKSLSGFLKTNGATSIFIAESPSLVGSAVLSEVPISSAVDGIVSVRYAELKGELGTVVSVLKLRGSGHSKELREYSVTRKGVVIGTSLAGYEGIITGVTRKVSSTTEEALQAEFNKTLGPIGATVFSELKDKGLSQENIFKYADSLVAQKILKPGDAESFKKAVSAILTGHAAPVDFPKK